MLNKLDTLFDVIENKEGFYKELCVKHIYSNAFGSKKQTQLMNKLKNTMIDTCFITGNPSLTPILTYKK